MGGPNRTSLQTRFGPGLPSCDFWLRTRTMCLDGVPWNALTALDCRPAWFCPHGAFSHACLLHLCLCICSSLAFWLSWTLGPLRCLMSCQSTCCLFYCHVNLVFCVHPGSIAWMGRDMHADERMCNWWENKRKCFFSPLLYGFTSHSASCDLWECIAGFLLWDFFSVSGCQVLLTTAETSSVYTIPRNPWNCRISWGCISLGIKLHLGSGWQAHSYLSELLTELWSHLILA